MSRHAVQNALRGTKAAEHLDVASFLMAIFKALKARDPSYTYDLFAVDLGFKPSNVGRLFATGARKMKASTALKVAEALGLQGSDRSYFLSLAALGNAVSPASRTEQRGRMFTLQERKAGDGEEFFRLRYFSSWLVPIVREALRVAGGPRDAEGLAKSLTVRATTREIQAALLVLEELGLVTRTEESFALRGQGGGEGNIDIPTGAAAGSLAILRYHESMLELSRQALDGVAEDQRDYNAMTVTVSDDVFELIRKRMGELCDEVQALEALGQSRDRTCQINVQMFPLTKRVVR